MSSRSTTRTQPQAEAPRLGRLSLVKAVLQGFRSRMDEELQPLGVTTAQMRMLWAVEENPGVSGAELARLCSVTPQTGQATITRMEAEGWIRRHPSEASERVLVAELTPAGRKLLQAAKRLAEALNEQLWHGLGTRDLAGMDAALQHAVEVLERKP